MILLQVTLFAFTLSLCGSTANCSPEDLPGNFSHDFSFAPTEGKRSAQPLKYPPASFEIHTISSGPEWTVSDDFIPNFILQVIGDCRTGENGDFETTRNSSHTFFYRDAGRHHTVQVFVAIGDRVGLCTVMESLSWALYGADYNTPRHSQDDGLTMRSVQDISSKQKWSPWSRTPYYQFRGRTSQASVEETIHFEIEMVGRASTTSQASSTPTQDHAELGAAEPREANPTHSATTTRPRPLPAPRHGILERWCGCFPFQIPRWRGVHGMHRGPFRGFLEWQRIPNRFELESYQVLPEEK